MFNATGPDDRRRPVRRPITAPTYFPLGASSASEFEYPTDTKPGPGEKTKTLKGLNAKMVVKCESVRASPVVVLHVSVYIATVHRNCVEC